MLFFVPLLPGKRKGNKKIISMLEITTFYLTPNTRAQKVVELLLATSAESCPKVMLSWSWLGSESSD